MLAALIVAAIGLLTTASAQSIIQPNFSSTAGITLNSAAVFTNGDGPVIRLSGTTEYDPGSAFTSTTRNVSAGFSTSFKFRLTSPGGITDSTGAVGADGLVFVVQRAGATALGATGDGLGYLGISNSVGVEFDTYYNSNRGDPNSNHVGVNTGGSVTSAATANVSPAFDNGAKWTAWVDYNGSVLEVRVAQDGIRPISALLSHSIDIASTIGGTTAFIGFTAATGAAFENHDILGWAFAEKFLAGGLTLYSWSGSGAWTDTTRWDPAAVPGATDIALVSSGIANVNDARSLGNLQFSGGTLGGTGTLTLTEAGSIWSGGSMTGTGTLKLAAGATLELSGATAKIYNRADGYGFGGRTIENLGTILWTGTGNLLGGDGGRILNQAGGLVDLKSDATLGYTGVNDVPLFANAGTLRKSAGTGTSLISQLSFVNSGMVDVLTGTLSFASSVTSNAGTFASAAGATLLFSGGQTFNTGTTFSGAGTTRIDGGTTNVAGTLASQNLNFAAGTLQGTAAVNGTLAWTGGAWSGTGTLTVNSGASLNISGAANKVYNRADGYGFGGRVIENFGTTTWTGTGQLLGGDGGQIINRGTGTFLVQNDTTLGYSGSNDGPVFTNQGAFRKTTATGTTTISGGSFVNTGLVDAQTGTLAFSNTVTSTGGTFNATAGSAITFSGGQVFNHGTSFSSPAGKIRILGGPTTLSGSLSANGLEFAGGDLYGNATVSGAMSWTGGTWRANGVVEFAAGSTLSLSGAADKNLIRGDGYGFDGRILRTAGTLVWNDAGRIVGNDGAGIDILSGGLFEIRNDSSYVYGSSNNIPALSNAGTVKKFASAGTTVFDSVAFTNTGLLQVLGGNLSLINQAGLANRGLVEIQAGTLTSSASGMTSNGGTFNVFSGAQLRYTGGTNTIVNSAFNGAGVTEVAGGTLVVSGSTIGGNLQLTSGIISGGGSFTVTSGGQFNWAGGSLAGTGSLAVATGGTLRITGNGAKTFYRGDGYGFGGRAISNAGTTIWTGTGSVLGGDGGAFSNLAGGLFDAQNDATFGYNNSNDVPTFANAGTVRKSAGTGVTTMAVPFYNTGIAESLTGTLRLSAGGSANGQFVANGGIIDFATSYTLNNGARFLGPTFSKLTAGSLTVPAAATATVGGTGLGRFALEGGVLDGSGVFQVGQFGETVWSAGGLASTGTLRVATGGTLNVSGAVNHDFYRGDGYGFGGRIIENSGTINWSDGNLRGGDGAQFINAAGGLFDITGGGTFGYRGTNDEPSFTNAGTLRKSAGGVTTFSQTAFATSGQIQVNSGTLVFATRVTSNAGTFFTAPGASLVFSSDKTFNSGTAFSGGGLAQATAGPTTINGTFSATNFELSGGSLYGTGTLASGLFKWSGGDLRGANTLTIANGAMLQITGTGDRVWLRGDGYGFGGRVIENRGIILVENSGNLLGNDGAQLINRVGGTVNLRNDAVIGYGGTNDVPSFTNEGTLAKTAGTGTSTIAIPFVNTGNIVVSSGSLAFTSSFTNTGGSMTLANGASFVTSGPLDLGAAPLSGSGTLTAASVIAGGLVSPGSSPGQLNITGNLTLLTTSNTLIELGGPTQGVNYDFLNVGGSGALAGNLQLSFLNGFQWTMPANSTFTVLTAASGLTGAFANVAPGQRLVIGDGTGSLQVNYGTGSLFAPNSVVLSNFVPIPEPSTWAMLGFGTLIVWFRFRRR